MKKNKQLVHKIKLPAVVKTFASKDSEMSPFEIMYCYLAKELGGTPKGTQMSVSEVFLTKDDINKLAALVKKWIKKYHKPYGTDTFINECYSYHNLEIGPVQISDKNIESGYIYATKEVFIKKHKQ